MPYPILFPLILLFCLIGVYRVSNSVVEIWFMLLFGVLGYLMKKFEYESPPLVLALILFDGNPMVFLTRPLSAAFLVVSMLLLLSNLAPWIRGTKHLLANAG